MSKTGDYFLDNFSIDYDSHTECEGCTLDPTIELNKLSKLFSEEHKKRNDPSIRDVDYLEYLLDAYSGIIVNIIELCRLVPDELLDRTIKCRSARIDDGLTPPDHIEEWYDNFPFNL